MSEPTFLLCHDGAGEWRVFAQIDDTENIVRNLVNLLNDTLGELGISIRSESESKALSRNADYLGRLRDQVETWKYYSRLYDEGINENLPDDFPCQFQSWQSLLQISESSDKKDLNQSNALESPEVDDQLSEGREVKTDWCFNFDPEAGSRYRHGPAKGEITQIAKAIGVNVKTVKKWNGRSTYFIRRLHSKSFKVWFDSLAEFEKVAGALPEH